MADEPTIAAEALPPKTRRRPYKRSGKPRADKGVRRGGHQSLKSGSQIAAKAIRRRKAIELKAAGATYEQIGDQLGVSLFTAYHDVMDAAAELDAETAKHAARYRDIELRTCDMMQRQLMPIVQGAGKGATASARASAANAIVKIQERRAKLLGLDAPDQHEVAGPGGGPVVFETAALSDEEILRRVEILRSGLLAGRTNDAAVVVHASALPDAIDAQAAAYEAVVRSRLACGNGHGTDGGT